MVVPAQQEAWPLEKNFADAGMASA